MRSSLLLCASLLAAPLHAQSSPACPVDPSSKGSHFPAYLTDSESQLKSEVDALRGIKFTKGATPADTAPILKQTGDNLASLLPRIPRLVANEELTQTTVRLPLLVSQTSDASAPSSGRRSNSMTNMSSSSQPLEGAELQTAIHSQLLAQTLHNTFSYRIQTQSEGPGYILQEFRTDSQSDPVDIGDRKPGRPQGIGFGTAWLQFLPANQALAQFRLIGYQKVDGRDTAVIAYAQTPNQLRPAEIAAGGGNPCSFLSQGIAWIDRSTFGIVRLDTDLLHPLTEIHLVQLRSDIHFSDIKISERSLSLTMPATVEITWMTETQGGAELHRYTNYRLFTAKSKLVINPTN